MLIKFGVVSVLAAFAVQAQAQSVQSAPSPLPIFNLEDGIPYVAESIIAPDTLQDIELVAGTDLYEKAKVSARVEDLAGSGFCTGFRIGPDLFMTNFHCWEVDQCQVVFHMGYEKDLSADQHAKFKCVEVLDKLEELDYAIYRVEPVGDDTTVYASWPVATLSKRPLVIGMPLLVPGHPSARPKQIDVSEQCQLTRAIPYRWNDRENIQHRCDTMGGSSGSPVMDRLTGHIIGIHWGATGGTDANHAIPMSKILERVSTTLPDVYAELTVSEN